MLERGNRNGAGPRGFLPSLSGYMLSSAATFGFFMSSSFLPPLTLTLTRTSEANTVNSDDSRNGHQNGWIDNEGMGGKRSQAREIGKECVGADGEGATGVERSREEAVGTLLAVGGCKGKARLARLGLRRICKSARTLTVTDLCHHVLRWMEAGTTAQGITESIYRLLARL